MAARTHAYRQQITRWRADPSAFWLEAAGSIDWVVPPTTGASSAATDGAPSPVHARGAPWGWFEDGVLNTSFNALDRHVLAGRANHTALVYDSAMTGSRRRYSYAELLDRVAGFAGALRRVGVRAGDRVVIYLPMIPEAVIAMLACARLGAVHSVVFGGFAAAELAARIDDAKPRVLVSATGGFEPGRTVEYLPLVAEALKLTRGSVETVIVHNRPGIRGDAAHHNGRGGARWIDWRTAELGAEPADPVPVAASDPLYILYTSGTTGRPKGIVRDNGGHAVALAWSMTHVYGSGPDDVFWAASDVGWVVGHSYIVYGPLLVGGTTVLYEGKPVGTPDAGAFWRVIEQNRVSTLLTAPTALRAIRRVDPELRLLADHDVSRLRAIFLAGERLDPDTHGWATAGVHCPVIDHWWQTETGWAISANPLGLELLPTKPGSATVPMPGYDIAILDDAGREVREPGREGHITMRLPLPPGSLLGVWGSPERFADAYLSAFPGHYASGDSGYLDHDGYLFVLGRTDDVINVAGHRLSTGSLEEVLAAHPDVAECAVVGVRDEVTGHRAAGFVTLTATSRIDRAELTAELVALVRRRIGPVAAFRDVTVLDRLPKTRSGKILRTSIRQAVDGEPIMVPATIEDPTVIDDVVQAVRTTPRGHCGSADSTVPADSTGSASSADPASQASPASPLHQPLRSQR